MKKTSMLCTSLSAAMPCPYEEDKYGDDRFFWVPAAGERMMCPYGEVWDQEVCDCIRGTYESLKRNYVLSVFQVFQRRLV